MRMRRRRTKRRIWGRMIVKEVLGGKRRWEALKAFAGENWTKKQNEVEGPHCCELLWTTEQFQ